MNEQLNPYLGTNDSQDDLFKDAACRDEDPELFFAPEWERKKSARPKREAAAIAICRRCVVMNEC